MCLDALKITSDDSIFNENHILFMLNKYRSILLQQKYTNNKEVLNSNYQSICLDLTLEDNKDSCDNKILKSKSKVPNLLSVGVTEVFPTDYYYDSNITFISKARMKYVGHNRWLRNIIYCSKGEDNYLYFKSSNPSFLQLEKVKLTGVFENPEEASKLNCDEKICDFMDCRYPIEEALASQLIDTVIKFMTSGLYKPEDTENNANDDLSTMMSFIRNNMKSNLQKQIEG